MENAKLIGMSLLFLIIYIITIQIVKEVSYASGRRNGIKFGYDECSLKVTMDNIKHNEELENELAKMQKEIESSYKANQADTNCISLYNTVIPSNCLLKK